jgi:hypothetical protein
MTGGQLVDARTINGGIESEVEIIQGTDLAKVGRFLTSGDGALLAHVELVLENDFQELVVRKSVGFGFVEAQLQGAKQSGETQSLRVFFEGIVGHSWLDGAELMNSE